MVLACLVLAACDPVGPVAGRKLSGEVKTPPADWTEIGKAEVVQLETEGPYSVNVWGVGLGPAFYVASAEGGETAWSKRISRDDKVRLRIGHDVFELQAVRVKDKDELEKVKDAYRKKYDLDAEQDFPEAIVYRLAPR